MKSTAQNMHLCGMPSTQVQRAARRIAAGPLFASEKHWQGGNMVVPGLIPTARSYAALLKGGALATAKFILYRCCSMLPCTCGASWVARPSVLPTIYHLQKYKERLRTTTCIGHAEPRPIHLSVSGNAKDATHPRPCAFGNRRCSRRLAGLATSLWPEPSSHTQHSFQPPLACLLDE